MIKRLRYLNLGSVQVLLWGIGATIEDRMKLDLRGHISQAVMTGFNE